MQYSAKNLILRAKERPPNSPIICYPSHHMTNFQPITSCPLHHMTKFQPINWKYKRISTILWTVLFIIYSHTIYVNCGREALFMTLIYIAMLLWLCLVNMSILALCSLQRFRYAYLYKFVSCPFQLRLGSPCLHQELVLFHYFRIWSY